MLNLARLLKSSVILINKFSSSVQLRQRQPPFSKRQNAPALNSAYLSVMASREIFLILVSKCCSFFSVTHFFTCAGYGAPTNVKVWKNADVLEWASSFSFSEDNRTTIIEFLRGGITGKVLLALTEEKLIPLFVAKLITFGAATELMLAIDALKAEIGMRVLCGVSTREVFLCRSVTFHAPGACGPCFPPCMLSLWGRAWLCLFCVCLSS